jgi:hypothetical protein
MDDPRENLLDHLDLLSCRVVFSASPIVLLCGGAVKEKERPEDPDPTPASFRHSLSKANTTYELFRPEEITNWQDDGIYQNLMDFEKDLASICTLVVIILESEGSIAELGAFSQLPDLSKKLIVIKSSEFSVPSFINYGILRYLTNENESCVKTYPWNITDPLSVSEDIIEDTIKDIQEELAKLKKTGVFKLRNHSHIIILICEIINLFVALKEKEILNYLRRFNVDIDPKELKSKLFLLERFNIIRIAEYSDSKFYLSGKDEFHKLRLVSDNGSSIDSLRIPVECIEYYNTTKDRHRVRVIKQHLGANKA